MTSLVNNKPMPFKKRQSKEDHYISSCTDCRWGIFSNMERIWTNRGLVHQTCEDKRLADEVKLSEAALHSG